MFFELLKKLLFTIYKNKFSFLQINIVTSKIFKYIFKRLTKLSIKESFSFLLYPSYTLIFNYQYHLNIFLKELKIIK